ncbi:MAG: hypothetical protein M3375_08805 [Actinomycetota bacterium]|nr:hypothetical protein [Actinomycetota bacterium]
MWSVRLTDSQRNAVRALLGDQPKLAGSLQGALENIEFARWDDLPEAALPWETVSELAAAQGIGEADVVWDMAARLRPQLYE